MSKAVLRLVGGTEQDAAMVRELEKLTGQRLRSHRSVPEALRNASDNLARLGILKRAGVAPRKVRSFLVRYNFL